MKNIIALAIILCCFLTCKPDETPAPGNISSHIEFFGFTLIDTYWDDPTDAEVKTNYADEVHAFSNLADILVVYPNDDLTQRIQNFHDLEMKAVLHFNELFFELVDTISPSGANYDLRVDYQDRWQLFKTMNESVLKTDFIGAFYIGEEPTWNGITFPELDEVTVLLKNDFPDIPIMIIEAYPALQDLVIPEQADWVGFDRYFVKNPNDNMAFQNDWAILKSKLSSPGQKIMVIMDSHYIDWAHGDFGGIALEEMDEVANNYYQLAKSDDQVIGILGYFWPNGFDVAGSVGARGMPEAVRATYQRMGQEITGK